MKSALEKNLRRAARQRTKLRKTSGGRLRLTVFRSGKNISAQIIDDREGRTLVAASTLEQAFKGRKGSDKAAATEVGKLIATRASEKGVKQVVFDRGAYIYHGRVKALADAAREGGLEF
jgi:large subunit ribosomal protein L18